MSVRSSEGLFSATLCETGTPRSALLCFVNTVLPVDQSVLWWSVSPVGGCIRGNKDKTENPLGPEWGMSRTSEDPCDSSIKARLAQRQNRRCNARAVAKVTDHKRPDALAQLKVVVHGVMPGL